MRINVYEEELGEGVEIVEKTSVNGESFYGLRIWLDTGARLLEHSTPGDDDRNAVTFWCRNLAGLHDLANQLRQVCKDRMYDGVCPPKDLTFAATAPEGCKPGEEWRD
jgi:hypothetical protein